MNEFLDRLKSDTPKFFIKLRNIATGIGASALAVISANSLLGDFVSPVVFTVAGYISVACIFVAGTAQLAKKDNVTNNS